MPLRYSSSSGRFYNDSNGQFVSQSHAMRSSIARAEYNEAHTEIKVDYSEMDQSEYPDYYDPIEGYPDWAQESMRLAELDREVLGPDGDWTFQEALFEDWEYWEDYIDDREDYKEEGGD